MYLASVVNLGMIWCFGFFFLELLDDVDEKSNNDDALASLDDADRKLGSDSDSLNVMCQKVSLQFLYQNCLINLISPSAKS